MRTRMHRGLTRKPLAANTVTPLVHHVERLPLAPLASVVLDTAIILAGLAGLIVVANFLWNTLGWRLLEKQRKYRQLARLAADVQLDFFTTTLARPPVLRREFEALVTEFADDGEQSRTNRPFVEHFFVDRDYVVQAICDPGERVLTNASSLTR
jgi:hypothetical protein